MLYALIVILIGGIGMLLYGWRDTNRFDIRKVMIEIDRLPVAFDGYTILQVSDLHNRAYGKDGLALERAVRELPFDMVAITGDLMDRHRPDQRDNGYRFVREASTIKPIYCVQGNHEWRIGWPKIKAELIDRGVRVLDNECVTIQRDNGQLALIGIMDKASIEDLMPLVSEDICSILLAHHPERIKEYERVGVDLVLSGHAHGGQLRLFGHGLFSPDQGILPRYTSGVYTYGGTKMYVSRGAGNHSFLLPRIFNRPEIDLITLKAPSR